MEPTTQIDGKALILACSAIGAGLSIIAGDRKSVV